MTFNDILENINSVSILDMFRAMAFAFCLGMLIYLTYKMTYRGVMFFSSFGITLVAPTMISTLVIFAVTSNVVLSLGMVGALSIVRIRTAIRGPMDIAFLFWAIAVGIVLAAGMIPLAVIGSVVICIMLFVFVNRKSRLNLYIVVLQCENSISEENAVSFLKGRTEKMIVKSKSARKGLVELNMEIWLRDDGTDFINTLSEMTGVSNAVLVRYNGDYLG